MFEPTQNISILIVNLPTSLVLNSVTSPMQTIPMLSLWTKDLTKNSIFDILLMVLLDHCEQAPMRRWFDLVVIIIQSSHV